MNTTQYKIAFGLIGICILLSFFAFVFGRGKSENTKENVPPTSVTTRITY